MTLARPVQVANRVDDRRRGEETRDHRQEDRLPHPERCDEKEGEKRAADGAEVIHGPLEAVRPSVGSRIDGVGKESVPGRDPQTARRPGARPEESDLPDGRGKTDQRRQNRGQRVATDRERSAPGRIIGQRPAGEFRRPSQTVGDALDDAQHGRGGTEGCGEERGQQRGRDLMAKVGQQASCPDAADARRQPMRIR